MGVISTHVLPLSFFFFFNDTATTEIYTLSLHDALPIFDALWRHPGPTRKHGPTTSPGSTASASARATPRDDAPAFAMGWPLQACYPGFRHSASRWAVTPVHSPRRRA